MLNHHYICIKILILLIENNNIPNHADDYNNHTFTASLLHNFTSAFMSVRKGWTENEVLKTVSNGLYTIVYKCIHGAVPSHLFQSLPIQVVVIFTQQHMETCWCLGRERWPIDHEVLLFLVLLSGIICHRPYVYRPLHLDSFRVD